MHRLRARLGGGAGKVEAIFTSNSTRFHGFLVPWLVFVLVLGLDRMFAGEVTARLHCLSLRFQPAVFRSLGQEYRLELTTGSPSDAPNGELALLVPESPATHGGAFLLTFPSLFETIRGSFNLDAPTALAWVDNNTNGFHDFYEIEQPLATIETRGYYEDALTDGEIRATWSRPANSRTGSCTLRLDGYNMTFTHVFEVLQFTGKLAYATSGTNITGSVQLIQSGLPTNTLAGPVQLSIDPTNQLVLWPGAWTNAAGQTLSYGAGDSFDRDGGTYFGFVFYDDGDPDSARWDYVVWSLVLHDMNDADADGVPDLTDPPAAPPPILTISMPGTGQPDPQLEIRGEAGQAVELQRRESLTQGAWTAVSTLTLTNSIHRLTLPSPTTATSFWRLLVR